ncbi:hypothetical protein [Clostridium formicaceticum]|uniref:Uncharacterized protein n=1 Tax=Clostridium formicaceticum TaxID=1497 RepID=A0AAC9RKM0_9CLOT|nr:hypothetical protein [Clostridium formicaceticum]AOY76920.1 hypothetical protein BJL90_14280 [Clostridium formicaceticum]ARE87399.1 hypothetical protein CLFO_17990 [Clostridium formicaceticum]
MLQGYVEKYKNDFEIQAIVTRIAIINAMGKKNYKVFPEVKKEMTQVDKESKEQTLQDLKYIFS